MKKYTEPEVTLIVVEDIVTGSLCNNTCVDFQGACGQNYNTDT